MSRLKAVAGAALVLGLLVLPPAISAGQQQAPADPVAGDPSAPQGGATGAPPPGGNQDGGNGGANADGDGSAPPAPQTVEVQQTETTAATAAKPAKQGVARFASSLTVSIGDNFYSPPKITIDVGDTVTWSNNGKAQHSATASDGSFDTGIFGPGGSRSHTFNQPGTFNYFCSVHGVAQSGTVTVSSAGGGGGGSGGGGTSEADAVASSGAAGDSTTLPLTGESIWPPLVVGLVLLGAGLALRLRDWAGPA